MAEGREMDSTVVDACLEEGGTHVLDNSDTCRLSPHCELIHVLSNKTWLNTCKCKKNISVILLQIGNNQNIIVNTL